MRRHAGQKILRKIEPWKRCQSIHQPVSGCRICANLELSQPYEARDATIHRSLQQVSQILAQGWRDAMGDKILDPALGLNQRIGAKALDRRGAGKDRARSEEHTSELQSLMRNSYAVFCLKNKIIPLTYKH